MAESSPLVEGPPVAKDARADRGSRFVELDSLRGLAALTVVVHHYLLPFSSEAPSSPHASTASLIRSLSRSPLYVLRAGHEAVVFFFVLSGFVLSIPFHAHRQLPYVPFAIRRVCRIWLPYVCSFAIAISARALLYSGDIPALSEWFNRAWSVPVTARAIGDHLLLVGSFDSGQYDPVYWSLTQEMRISLLFPLVVWLTGRFGWPTVLALGLAGSVAANTASLHTGALAVVDWLQTAHYVSMFLIGALVAKHRQELLAIHARLSTGLRTACAIVVFMGYAYGRVAHRFLPNMGDWPVALAAGAVIVASLAEGPVRDALGWIPVRWLGRVSYSLYLLHGIVLLGVLHGLYGRAPVTVLLGGGVCLSALLAFWMQRYVEAPSTRLGHWLGRRAMASTAKTTRPAGG